jgi:hypothetical protein
VPVPISPDHPIRALFHSLVQRSLERQSRLSDPELARYLSNVLVEFTHRDQLFRIRNAEGRRLEEVGEMLVEGDVSLNATSFEREREVHKHIGDYTLFWTGVYPEMLRYLRASSRGDHLLDYVEQGRKSYRIASSFEYGRYAEEAPVLRQLSEQFESCMLGLHMVRKELESYSTVQAQAFRRLLDS